MCQPLHSLYRKFGSRLSVTKDTLLVVSPQTVATFCKFRRFRQRYVINSPRGEAVPAIVFSPDPGLTSWAIMSRPFGAGVCRSGPRLLPDISYPRRPTLIPTRHATKVNCR